MSGILLPGQDKQPDSEQEGKIELPKGFTRPKKEEAPKQEAPSQSEAPASGAAPAGPAPTPGTPQPGTPQAGAQRRSPGQDLLFPPRGAQIQCPACGTPYTVAVFSILDLGANPELRGALLSGQINMGVCPSCGAGGSLGAPLLVHDPENDFLGVYMPMEGGRNDMERQRIIGELTQTLMRKIPSEKRRGYMLQPTQFMDWQRFMEKMWGFEGVTPEMLRRQRDQSALLQNLMGIATDPKAVEMAIGRNPGLIDRDFFSMLDQIVMMARSQGQAEQLAPLMKLRQTLLDTTPAGQEVKQQQEKIRGLLAKITPEMGRGELVDLILDAWQGDDGEHIVGSVAVGAAGLFDYEFLMALNDKVGQISEPAAREKAEELRDFLVEIQQQLVARQQDSQQAMAQQAQALLQEVLGATNIEETLRENMEVLDENFLALIAANMQQAERSKATGAARRLRTIYEKALAILQENLPDDLRLLNQLISAPDEAALRTLLKENRPKLTREFVESLKPIEEEMRQNDRKEIADRIKSVRAQITLMM